MRIATLNVDTLNGKVGELSNAMEKHRLDILCLQETKEASNGNETISDRYIVYYSGGNGQTNGVAVCVKEKWPGCIEVIRPKSDFYDRIIAIKLEIQNRIFNIFSVYAPQTGLPNAQVAEFWKELTEITDRIPLDEELIVAGDFNGHVGAEREGFDMWHGGYSIGKRNTPGQRILEFARVQNLVLVNTFFTKKPTLESGEGKTIIDYLTIRRDSRVIIGGCEVTSERSLAPKHNLVLMDLWLQWTDNVINWWKLNTLIGDKLLPKLRELLENESSWSETTYKAIILQAREILGGKEQGNFLNNQSWWWDDEEKEVCLNEEQRWIIAMIARASKRKIISNNFSVSPFNKRDEGQIKRRWKDYFGTLLNSKSGISITPIVKIPGIFEAITDLEVKEQINSMEFRKERDLNHIPIILVKKLGDKGISWLLSILKDAIRNEIPDMWKQRKITLKLKKNRDPLECKNYYGIHSSSDFLALLEGILKKRLQEKTNIKEKSTTESVFCIRMFQERQREFKEPLHMILIKLGNACNTTPSEGVWNCLRRKRVPESYISLIKHMYSNCKARVVTGVGETEEFQINCNLPRGSVLSNLILAIVLNVIIDELKWKFPWAMVHGDCIVLSDVEVRMLQYRLQQFQMKLKDVVGLMLHQMEIEYMSPTSLEDSIYLLNRTSINSCLSFKFLQTTIQRDGGCKKEVERKIGKAWGKWHKVKGFLCDKNVPLTIKAIIYEKVIRRALLYDCETWPISEKEMENINKCEMRILRYCLDAAEDETDDSVRKTLNVTDIQTIMRERRLLWYGKVIRNELSEEVGKIFGWEVQNGRRGQGRPKLKWEASIKKDIEHLIDNAAKNEDKWKQLVRLLIH